MDKVGFENNRSKVAPFCPCGKSNSDGKFAPFKGETQFGKCHSCSEVFFPPKSEDSNAPITNAQQKYIDYSVVEQSQEIIHDDPFFKYAEAVIGDSEKAHAHLKSMGVGSRNGYTTFWMIDEYGRVCLPKGMKYDVDGHRTKDVAKEKDYNAANSYYKALFNASSITEDKTVILVESEKSAVMAQYFFPEYTWVSCGGASGLSYDVAFPLKGKNVILLYDADEAGRIGAQKAEELLKDKLNCRVQNVEITPERVDGYDIADALSEFSKEDGIIKEISGYFAEANAKLNPEKRSEIIRMSKEQLKANRRSGKKHKGETTHFHELDPHFLLKKRMIYTFTGLPGAGKSEVTLFIAFLKSYYSKWRWILFVPESLSSNEEGNYTDEIIVDRLVHTYFGMTADLDHIPHLSDEQYERGIDWVHDHFTIIMPDELLAKQHDVIRVAEQVNEGMGKHDGIIVDPFNTLDVTHRKDELLDQANRRTIYEAKGWSVRNNMAWIYVTHPGKPMRTKDGGVIKPTLYDIRGGMGFVNGSDLGIIIHRPWYNMGMVEWKGKDIPGTQHPQVEFTVAKIKEKFALGAEEGTVDIFYNKMTNRYENSYGLSPMDEAYRNEYTPGKPNYGKLPEVERDEDFTITLPPKSESGRRLTPLKEIEEKEIQSSLDFKENVDKLYEENDEPPF